MSKVEFVQIRITAIEWCLGCNEWFSEQQIEENRRQFAAFEAEQPHDSVRRKIKKRRGFCDKGGSQWKFLKGCTSRKIPGFGGRA